MQYEKVTPCNDILNNIRKRIGERECKCYENNVPCIIVHGGAGNFSDSLVIEKMTACKKAAINGYKMLMSGESSVDAVETALWWLECDEFFNCSYGSVLNEIGNVQMDASIMDGLTFKCGSVAAVSDIEHPITLAKYVMNNFPNSIFVGDGAKRLAKHANLNWISEGNMVAPIARIAFHSAEKGKYEADIDNQSLLDTDMLTNSFGTVGCVAYDGYGMAAGTTTGGLNKKLVGRVGDTPLLGCGTYATRNIGCSLTGHGESIIKLGLARAIVEDINYNVSKEEVLQKHFSYMLKKFEKTGGGIVLQSDGSWSTYFTSDKMPYAAIENDLITIAIERGLLNEKLFSFQEWQRYIECRKTILVRAHFPTKVKYSPDALGMDDLYVKFLDFISSKTDKKEADVKSSKHFLPEELIDAMTQHISSLSINDLSSKAIDIFPPSLTPLHSYLQHLLDHPSYDIPIIAKNDFFLTKVGYMTKPDLLTDLTVQCNIKLELIDSGLHFLEKVAPPFEQPKMPSIKELKELVDVEDNSKNRRVKKSENLNNYLHAKIPCRMKFDVVKEQYYDSIKSTTKNLENTNLENDFTFTETLPDGKLAVPSDSDTEDEEEEQENTNVTNNINQEYILLKNKFCNKYNLSLSLAEKESISKSGATKTMHFKKRKLKMARNEKGQFVKGSTVSVKVEGNSDDSSIAFNNSDFDSSTQVDTTNEMHTDIVKVTKKKVLTCENTNLGCKAEATFSKSNDLFNLSDISLFSENGGISASEVNEKKEEETEEKHQFFRPFKEYWMYHCIFSRVKPKNFAVFERALPRTFRWLLNECALIVEMSTEDLYEEVCLIESYYTHVLKPSNTESDNHIKIDPISKNQLNLILSKW